MASFIPSSGVREHDDPLRVAKHFFGSGFSDAVLSVASVGVEDEDATVFAADLDRLSGGRALVE